MSSLLPLNKPVWGRVHILKVQSSYQVFSFEATIGFESKNSLLEPVAVFYLHCLLSPTRHSFTAFSHCGIRFRSPYCYTTLKFQPQPTLDTS